MYCDVYKWRGHKYDTPLHNSELDTVNVIRKCRCGKTKDEIRYVPLPDTEEYETYKIDNLGHDDNDEEYHVSYTKPIFTIVLCMVSIIVLLNTLPVISETILGNNTTNDTIPHVISLIPIVFGAIIFIAALAISFNYMYRND